MAATRKGATRKPAARRPTLRKTAVKAKRPATRKAPARAKVRTGVKPKALRLGGVASDAVLRATGRAWDEWLRVLDRAGAKTMPHKDIALLLSRKFQVPNWWSQMVTVGYEQARGLRVVNQHADGFATSASKTMGIAVARVYDAWSDPKARSRWLPGAPLEVRRATDGKSIRMAWTVGDSKVEVAFVARGADRSQVQVTHGKLKSATAVTRQKAYWSEALERLKAMLEAKR